MVLAVDFKCGVYQRDDDPAKPVFVVKAEVTLPTKADAHGFAEWLSATVAQRLVAQGGVIVPHVLRRKP